MYIFVSIIANSGKNKTYFSIKTYKITQKNLKIITLQNPLKKEQKKGKFNTIKSPKNCFYTNS